MVSPLITTKNPLITINSCTQHLFKDQIFTRKIRCNNNSQKQNSKKPMKEYHRRRRTQSASSVVISPGEEIPAIGRHKPGKSGVKRGFLEVGDRDMVVLCGVGYYVNGFRGFPWLALNFHMAHNLNMHPSALQIVQNSANLPMVAKPFYGILSDALYIGGARRLPYISIGVVLQVLSWGSLALIPVANEALAPIMACILLGNLGASISEVAKDALVAEYGHNTKLPGLQSYAYMASAIGGVLGNLLGGFFLLKTHQTKSMFLAFAAMLMFQLTISLTTREESLGLSQPSIHRARLSESVPQIIKKQYSDLTVAVKEEGILHPLFWLVSSILVIPMLSGSIFCYQTQCLNLDPLIIGMSKVTGQLMLLGLAVVYNRFGKTVPMRNLAVGVQILYAFSLLLDLVLVKGINIQIGISNEVFTLCFSGLAETIGQFKLLPFYVFFASLAPQGCEGSLMSFLASVLCLSSIFSGFLGVGFASFLGINSGDYSRLPLGIVVQFVLALLPLCWIGFVPDLQAVAVDEKCGRIGRSKRTRMNRRVGRVVFDSAAISYRRERESDLRR
ncbi:hypothetical protein ABFS82_07G055400 [Erythranthe guttata]